MAEGSKLKETIERLKHNPLVRALLANTRAGVLAACHAKVNWRIQLAQDGGLPGDMQDESLLALVLKDLEQLQPAASDLEAHDEEIRLEMLASFLRRIDYSLIEGYAAVSSAEAKGYNEALTDLQNGLDDFKPTAKALEALLREARLKGRIAQLKMMKGDDAGGMWFPDPGTQTINDRIAELEKARASAGKGTDG